MEYPSQGQSETSPALPTVQLRPIEALKPYTRNARRHSTKQISKIAASIREFGFTNPILIDAEDNVLAGHGRLEAAKRVGLQHVPALRIEHLSPAQKRAYVIADNRLAELAGWDNELLAIELQELIDLDFDVGVIGFDTPELDVLFSVDDEDADDETDAVAEDQPCVSRVGDLWLLGRHRLLCGDATKAESYSRLLGDERAQMAFTDPPYNVRIDGHVTVAGNAKHGEFVMASGEMSRPQFTSFLGTVFKHATAASKDGAIHFVCMDWRHIGELLKASQDHYSELKNLCVWNKDNGGMGSLYRSKHELVFVFKHGRAPHINNIELGKHGRNRTNVWDYPGASSAGRGRLKTLAMHPTVKPVAMVADAIKDCSERDGLVMDPFGGSGSTLMAAHRTRRRAALLELDPRYVDVIVRRFERRTGIKATLADVGSCFSQLAAERDVGSGGAA